MVGEAHRCPSLPGTYGVTRFLALCLLTDRQACGLRAAPMSGSLSVPSNGSMWMQLRTDAYRMLACTSFSTLERVDVDATTPDSRASSFSEALSVPSNGSMWMQQAGERRARSVFAPFSTLERVDVDATQRHAPAVAHHPPLSVPSNGSMWMQHRQVVTLADGTKIFQYPRTGRCGCNSAESLPIARGADSFSTLERVDVDATTRM
jgi:hypothetical protein